MSYPQTRMRRLRATAGLRGLVRETDVRAARLVLPMFVAEAVPGGGSGREPIATMPGDLPFHLLRDAFVQPERQRQIGRHAVR